MASKPTRIAPMMPSGARRRAINSPTTPTTAAIMAIASHELKTPITSLRGYTQLLHTRFVRAGDEGSAARLAKMDVQLDKLITLINELLDVTKIEAGQLAWHNEQFDLNTLVRDLVE